MDPLPEHRFYKCHQCQDTGLIDVPHSPAWSSVEGILKYTVWCPCCEKGAQMRRCWDEEDPAAPCSRCHGTGLFVWRGRQRKCGCPAGEKQWDKL